MQSHFVTCCNIYLIILIQIIITMNTKMLLSVGKSPGMYPLPTLIAKAEGSIMEHNMAKIDLC